EVHGEGLVRRQRLVYRTSRQITLSEVCRTGRAVEHAGCRRCGRGLRLRGRLLLLRWLFWLLCPIYNGACLLLGMREKFFEVVFGYVGQLLPPAGLALIDPEIGQRWRDIFRRSHAATAFFWSASATGALVPFGIFQKFTDTALGA